MKKIYLVRHGQSTTNAGGQMMPNADIELTDLGHQQARGVADWVIDTLGDDINGVHVSPYMRTRQTAQPLLDKLNVEPNIIESLHEFNYLSVAKTANLSFEERVAVAHYYWDNQQPSQAHGDDAETFDNFYERVAQGFEVFKTLSDGNHLVYTHGFWISMLIWQILGQPARGETAMRKFKQFEQSIRAQNGEVFCLVLPSDDMVDSYPPAITKVRILDDQQPDFSP